LLCEKADSTRASARRSWTVTSNDPGQWMRCARSTRSVRKECLNLNWFHSLDGINEHLGQWYKTYNFDRPHSSMKYKTPTSFENLNRISTLNWNRNKGGSTHNHHESGLNFRTFNRCLIEKHTGSRCMIAFDPSYISKIGKCTPGVGYYSQKLIMLLEGSSFKVSCI